MHKQHDLQAMIIVDPKKAKEQILVALRKAKAHKGKAARVLGCAHGTLLRWIAALDMSKDVDKLVETAAKEGWIHTQNRRGGFTKQARKRKRSEARINPG